MSARCGPEPGWHRPCVMPGLLRVTPTREEPVTHRIISYFALIAMLGCGGMNGAEEPTSTTTSAGTESPPPASASTEPPPSSPSAMTPSASGTVSDQEVQDFANVYRQLLALEMQGSERVQAGEDAESVAMELQPQVAQIFEGTAITPERFDEIAERANEDEALRQRIEAELANEMPS